MFEKFQIFNSESDAIFIKRIDKGKSVEKILKISRKSGDVNVETDISTFSEKNSIDSFESPCILGIIRLLSCSYLLFVKKAKLIWKLCGHDLFQIEHVEMMPVDPKSKQTLLSNQEKSDEDSYLNLLGDILNEKTFYYSPTLNLTLRLQDFFTNADNPVDDHFMWNRYLSKEFSFVKADDDFIFPVIRGFIEFKSASVQTDRNVEIVIGLISRQSCKRVGTRYNIRGLDPQGNAANFVETEQVVILSSQQQKDSTDMSKQQQQQLFSLIQIRGSVPVIWSQKANLKYKPGILIQQNSEIAFKAHLDYVLNKYKETYLVNLIDQKGSEKKLAEAYASHVKNYQMQYNKQKQINYIEFDFHHECRNMNYGAVDEKLIVPKLNPFLQSFQFFCMDYDTNSICVNSSVTIRCKQVGVVRTNCMDNLDRTNVVQGCIAKQFIIGVLSANALFEKIDDSSSSNSQHFQLPEGLSKVFMNLWADHGDVVSLMYSGTGALKNDFTRTGKRTFMGYWNDFTNSVIRYYLNNFSDGSRQDSMNLLLGKYVVNQKSLSPFRKQTSAKFIHNFLKYSLFTGVFMTVANLLMIFSDINDYKNRALFIFGWGLFSFVIYYFFGNEIVSKPLLVESKKES